MNQSAGGQRAVRGPNEIVALKLPLEPDTLPVSFLGACPTVALLRTRPVPLWANRRFLCGRGSFPGRVRHQESTRRA